MHSEVRCCEVLCVPLMRVELLCILDCTFCRCPNIWTVMLSVSIKRNTAKVVL